MRGRTGGNWMYGLLLVLWIALCLPSVASAGTAEEVESVPVRDDFARSEVPLATGKFTKATWATAIGGVWNGTKHGFGSDSAGNLSSAYWNQESFNDATAPVFVTANVGTGSALAGQYVGLWLDMPSPSSAKSGYEARFTGVNGSSSNYKVELSKWVAGTRTVLTKKEGFTLATDATMAFSKSAGQLTLWTGSGGSYSVALSAADSTYTSGYAGIEVIGTGGTYYDFRAGNSDFPILGDSLTGTSCSAAAQCTAVGTTHAEGKTRAQAVSWDGSAWKAQTLPSPPSGATATELADLACASPTECSAVGSYVDASAVTKTFAMRLSGGSWSN